MSHRNRGVAIGPVRPWTAEEDELLLEYYARGQVSELAELLGRTVDAVHNHYHRIQHNRDRTDEIEANRASQPFGAKRWWTPEEHEFVAQTLDEPVAEVAACVNRSIFATQMRRHQILRGDTFRFMEDSPASSLGGTRRRPAQDAPVDLSAPRCDRCFCHHRGDC